MINSSGEWKNSGLLIVRDEGRENMILLLMCMPLTLGQLYSSSGDSWVAPYNFSLDPTTHQLHTTWEVHGAGSISLLCAFSLISLVELGWTGESNELSSGNSWAISCKEGEQGDKMVIEVDITKFRVQPFKSYKVCVSVEEDTTMSHLAPVCTHLFSFEKSVPYIPEDNTVKKEEHHETGAIAPNTQSQTLDEESVLQEILDDTRDFVSDGIKVESEQKYVETNKNKKIGGSSNSRRKEPISVYILSLNSILMLLFIKHFI